MTGEHLSVDLLALIRILAEHKVRFIVVGGEAVIHHGYPRVTGDLDLFWHRTDANAARLFAALTEFWAGPIPGIVSVEELARPGYFVQFGRPPNRVDLLGSLGTVEFEQAWRNRDREYVDIDGERVPFPIIGLEDLLQAKRDAGRLKDLLDIEQLTKE